MCPLESSSSVEFGSYIAGHFLEQSCSLIMVSLTGICSSFCFPFTSTWICLALPEKKHICSEAFQNTQTVCLYKVVNLSCPSWQMHFLYLVVLCAFGCQARKLHSPQVAIKMFLKCLYAWQNRCWILVWPCQLSEPHFVYSLMPPANTKPVCFIWHYDCALSGAQEKWFLLTGSVGVEVSFGISSFFATG